MSEVDFLLYRKDNPKAPLEFNNGLPELMEMTPYLLEGHGLGPVSDLISVLMPGTAGEPDLLELNFGNFVGQADLYGKHVRIKSKKISSEGFNQLLSDISAEISNLPFDFNTPTYLPYERSSLDNSDVLYQRFVHLRQIILHDKPSLEEQFRLIASNPHRSTLRTPCEYDISNARNVTAEAIRNAVSRPENLVRVHDDHPAYYLPAAMTVTNSDEFRFIPLRISDHQLEGTFDNLENRFIKHFLKEALLVIELIHQLITQDPRYNRFKVIGNDHLHDIRVMTNTLEQMLSADFLMALGPLASFPSSSQVLQKALGYREMLGHWNKLSLASQYPVDAASLRRILEVKDIATLYEYWCFFSIAAILRSLCGEPDGANIVDAGDLKAGVRRGIDISFPGNINLGYNTFYPGVSASGSYSVGLRPDISLRVCNTLHLIDAKFKYDKLATDLAKSDESVEHEESVYGRFKLGDLYKMHTYRDAITGARSVSILYPGDEFVFFEESGSRRSEVTDIDSASGVGAIPLKPQSDVKTLTSFLELLLSDTASPV